MEPNALHAAWNRDYVYFIGMVADPSAHHTGHQVCKIGRAHNLNSRMAQLQTGNPRRLYLIASALVDDAVAVELDLHQQYAVNRIEGGEWFELTDADVIDITTIMGDYK